MNGNNKAITIFGGSGDLTYRKLLPALYKISLDHGKKDMLRIIAVGRRDYQKEDYIEIARTWVKKFSPYYDDKAFERFSGYLDYYRMDIEHLSEYQGLNMYYQSRGINDHIFYFAVAPRMFLPITEGIRSFECSNHCKVVVEKPFGENLAAAASLNAIMEEAFGKENIFHIDHYLGKEMIQSIQTIRFKNAIFKGIWNRDYIENVQISAFESVGVETRGGYYDESGALRDMVQNHLFQVLSIVAMEEPDADPASFHRKQLEVLDALVPLPADKLHEYIVLGQYEGYRQEPKVKPDSNTETYVALKLFVDQPRWQGVPFYIRTGKKLNKRDTEVIIQFKRVDPAIEGNVLIIKIQPNEGVYFRFHTKKPGISNEVEAVSMDFCQNCVDLYRINTPEAYERLLLAVANGDHALFSPWDQIVKCWNYIDDVVAKVRQAELPVVAYAADTEGPAEANQMLLKENHHWFNSDIREEI